MEERADKSYLIDKKIDYLVDMKISKLQSQLSEAMTKINKLTEEIDVLKNKVQRLDLGAEPQTKLTDAGEKEVKKEVNSKTGEFTSQDVSVEKMFYFGNKD